MSQKVVSSWGMSEFGSAILGDTRLTNRLVKLADSFANGPESSINQACGSWSEAKAAYRFFQNDNVKESEILDMHVSKTVERIENYNTVLVIQDTSYIKYTSHKKTTGLGVLFSNAHNAESKGLVMHTAFAVSTEGLVLGMLDQKIHARPEIPEELKALKEKSHRNAVRIEDKESIRWLDSLKKTVNATNKVTTQIVTV